MTSLDIAELCGKQHKHVMRDIRNMEPALEKVNGSKFGLIEYTDLRGRFKPCYSLSKTECLYIATKYDDEMRAKLVLRWEKVQAGKFSLLQKSYDYNAYKRVKKYFFTHGLHGIVHFYKKMREIVRFVGKFLYLCTLE